MSIGKKIALVFLALIICIGVVKCNRWMIETQLRPVQTEAGSVTN